MKENETKWVLETNKFTFKKKLSRVGTGEIIECRVLTLLPADLNLINPWQPDGPLSTTRRDSCVQS